MTAKVKEIQVEKIIQQPETIIGSENQIPEKIELESESQFVPIRPVHPIQPPASYAQGNLQSIIPTKQIEVKEEYISRGGLLVKNFT